MSRFMPPYDPNSLPAEETNTPPLSGEPVFVTDDTQEALSCSLVLSSTGIGHHLAQKTDKLVLSVDAENLEEAHAQLQAYFHENRNWPPRPVTPDRSFIPLLQPPTVLLIGAMALFYTITGPWAGDSFWFSRGAGDAEAILDRGEWYRLITALSLHADATHLLGNCLLGGFLFHFFCRLTGNGLGLFSMLLTATVANLINVIVHGSNHLFVGFSTAVFTIVGMLAMLNRQHRTQTGYIRLMPFMAGAALLAMLGSSGERTDLGAHLFGLCCGLAAGWIIGRAPLLRLRHSMTFQTVLFVLFSVVLFLAWKSALL